MGFTNRTGDTACTLRVPTPTRPVARFMVMSICIFITSVPYQPRLSLGVSLTHHFYFLSGELAIFGIQPQIDVLFSLTSKIVSFTFDQPQYIYLTFLQHNYMYTDDSVFSYHLASLLKIWI